MQGRTRLGAGAKFRAFDRAKMCESSSCLAERFTTHQLPWSNTGACLSKKLYIGYLSNFVHKYVYSYLSRRKERDDQRPRTTLTLLYSNNFSEAVDHPKDLVPAVPAEEQKSVVYCVPCDGCPEKSIGQTGRCLKHRLAEHRHALKKGDVATSALAGTHWEQAILWT